GRVSPCSNGLGYRHDGLPPIAPVFDPPMPGSPSSELVPYISGLTEPDATVWIHTSPGCSDAPVAQPQADAEGRFSVRITVLPNDTTRFSASAFDVAGNGSACVDGPVYVHDAIRPNAPVLSRTQPASPSTALRPLLQGLAE